jgi:hypothetical protein
MCHVSSRVLSRVWPDELQFASCGRSIQAQRRRSCGIDARTHARSLQSNLRSGAKSLHT